MADICTESLTDHDTEAPESRQTAKFTHRQSRQLSVFEEHLEQKELHDKADRPTSRIKRLRKSGEKLLHSKAILLLVVILNGLDCTLVLSELVLDVYFIKGSIDTAEYIVEKFNSILQNMYPDQFTGIPVHDIHTFYNKVLKAQLVWDNNSTHTYSEPGCRRNWTDNILARVSTPTPAIHTLVMSNEDTFQNLDDPAFLDEKSDSLEEHLSHAFHKVSITILALLVLYTVLKVFCYGIGFLKHKLEVFDGVVVLSSFALDVCYIQGLTNYPAESFILTLAIMIPWRIIRVLNSLVIAVKDNYHFLLKLMYKKNKNHIQRIQYLENRNALKQKMINTLLKICKSNGIANTQDVDWLDVAGAGSNTKKDIPDIFGSCFGLSKNKESFYDGTPVVSFQLEQHPMLKKSLANDDISNGDE